MTTDSRLLRLENAPLVHVIGQVVFSPLLDIADSLKEVQTGLRQLGYIKLKSGPVGLQIQFQEGVLGTPKAIQRWEFLDREDRNSVVLSTDFFALQTSAYTTFAAFARRWARLLEVVANHTEVSWIQRIGLRYLNLVRPAAGENYGEYLRSELLGFPFGQLEGHLTPGARAQFATQAQINTTVGTLVVRSYVLPAGQFVPPELTGGALKYPQAQASNAEAAVLDVDSLIQDEHEFENEFVMNRIESLHEVARAAFRAGVTPKALKRWGPEVEEKEDA